MKLSIIKRIEARTQPHEKIFAQKYAEIVLRIHELLKERNMTQKDLAIKLGKRPSEINKWLRNSHNVTLQTITRLEAVFEEEIIEVRKTDSWVYLGSMSYDCEVTKPSIPKHIDCVAYSSKTVVYETEAAAG